MKLLERLHYSQRANLSCVGDSAGCVIAGNLTLTGHYYWLEEQLSAGHFGTDLNHSRYTTSVADGAHLLTCMIGGFEEFCDRLGEPGEVSGVFAFSNRPMLVFLTLWFVAFDPCLWRLASSAAVFKNLPLSFLPRGAFMYHA